MLAFGVAHFSPRDESWPSCSPRSDSSWWICAHSSVSKTRCARSTSPSTTDRWGRCRLMPRARRPVMLERAKAWMIRIRNGSRSFAGRVPWRLAPSAAVLLLGSYLDSQLMEKWKRHQRPTSFVFFFYSILLARVLLFCCYLFAECCSWYSWPSSHWLGPNGGRERRCAFQLTERYQSDVEHAVKRRNFLPSHRQIHWAMVLSILDSSTVRYHFEKLCLLWKSNVFSSFSFFRYSRLWTEKISFWKTNNKIGLMD